MTVRLCIVFAFECLLVIAGFAIVITLTLLNEDKLIANDVNNIINAKMASNSEKVLTPLLVRENHVKRTIVSLQSRNLSCKDITVQDEGDFAAHIPTWMLYHTALMYDALAAFMYEDWYVPGDVDPNNPGAQVWQECGCEALVPQCGRYWNLTRYAFNAGRNTADYDMEILTRRTPANPGAAAYVTESIRTIPVGNTVGRWPAPYTWPILAPSGQMVITALYSYYRCIEWDSGTGDCIHSLGMDLSLDSITQYISALATTPTSTVALIDRTSNVLLAHNDDFPQFGSDDQSYTADATPSSDINNLVRKFNSHCTGTCQHLVDIGSDYVTASYAFQSTSGLDLLLLDITPRSHYYGLFDDNRKTGIIIAVIVPFFVVLVCVLVLISVSKPLEAIAEMMEAAATMRVETVAKPSRWMILTEIALLQQSYETMHSKLLELKPYVPAALFVRTDRVENGGRESDNSSSSSMDSERGHHKKRSAVGENGDAPQITVTTTGEGGAHPAQENEENPLSARGDNDRGNEGVQSWKFGSSVTTMNSSSADSTTMPHRVMLGNLGAEMNSFRRVNCSVLYLRVEYDYASDTNLVGQDVGSIMESVLTLVSDAGGVLEVHRPEALLVSFGAQNSLATHHTEATMCALNILKRLRRRKTADTPQVSIIVDTSEYYVGTCGTRSRLSRVIFGERVPLLLQLHRLAGQVLRSPLLVTEKTAMSLSSGSVILIPVDAVLPSFAGSKPMMMVPDQPGGVEASTSHLSINSYAAIKLYEVVDNRKKRYTVEELSQLGTNQYKTAFSALVRGEGSNANAAFQAVLAALQAHNGTRSKLGALMQRNVERLLPMSTVKGSSGGSDVPYQRRQTFPFELLGDEVIDTKRVMPSRLWKPPMQVEDLSGNPRSVNDLSQVVAVTVGRQHAQGSSTSSDSDHDDRVQGASVPVPKAIPTPLTTPRPQAPKEEEAAKSDEGAHNNDAEEDGGGLFEMFGVEDHQAQLDENPNGVLGELPTIFEDQSQGISWNRSKEVLGSGAFSTVYKGLSSSGMVVALKCIDLSHRHINVHDLVAEVNLACSLRHENIVNHFGWARSDRYLAIAMEMIVGGSLMNILESFGAFSFATFRRYACDALNGLAFLHSRGIVHADVKPHNMLVATDGSCKLGDFGSSIGLGGSIGPDVTTDVFGIRGTSLYMSAETADGNEPTFASDIWALGISFYQLITGSLPWQYSPSFKTGQSLGALMRNDALFMQAVGRRDVIAVVTPASIPDPLMFEFVALCLKTNPQERASASLLLQDRLFM